MTSQARTEAPAAINSEVLVSYVLFIGTAALLVALFALPMFRVSKISVKGPPQAQTAVANALSVTGANIFTIQTANVLAAVWRVPNVIPCGAPTLSLPDTLAICVRMRRPVLGWQTPSGLMLVDKYGRIVSSAASTSLPILRDTTGTRRQVGKYVNPWIVFSASYALASMRHAAVDGFVLKPKHGLVIRSRHQWRALLGFPDNRRELVDRLYELKSIIGHGFKIGHPLQYADLTRHPLIARWHGLASSSGGMG